MSSIEKIRGFYMWLISHSNSLMLKRTIWANGIAVGYDDPVFGYVSLDKLREEQK